MHGGGGDAELAGGGGDGDHVAILGGCSDGTGGDGVVVAQAGDAVRGERLAGGGAAALAREDRRDLLVGVVLGQAAHERDRVLVGGAREAGGVRQADRVLGRGAALPDDPQPRDVRVALAVDGDDDLGEDGAQQLLALAVGGGGCVEYRAQVSAGVSAPGDLLAGERVGAAGGDRGERAFGAGGIGEALLPFVLERARH